jgi:hypothetical protein
MESMSLCCDPDSMRDEFRHGLLMRSWLISPDRGVVKLVVDQRFSTCRRGGVFGHIKCRSEIRDEPDILIAGSAGP